MHISDTYEQFIITGVRTSQDPDGLSHKSTPRDKAGSNDCKTFLANKKLRKNHFST